MTDDPVVAAVPAPARQHDDDPPLSVWATAQHDARTQRQGRYLPESTAHPGKMLPAIAATAITRYTKPGDLVADPMCGIGTTLVEAVHLGRDGLGVEYEQRWATVAAANISHARHHGAAGTAEVIHGDARQLDRLLPPGTAGQAALILTSPPYGPSIHGQVKAEARAGGGKVAKWDNRYGTDPANLASRRLDDLLAGLTEILAASRVLLKPGGLVVVTTRPFRQRGELVDFPGAVLAAGQAAGLVPAERCVALLAALHDSELVARPSFFQLKNLRAARARGMPWHLIAHEDVLVLSYSALLECGNSGTPGRDRLRGVPAGNSGGPRDTRPASCRIAARAAKGRQPVHRVRRPRHGGHRHPGRRGGLVRRERSARRHGPGRPLARTSQPR